MTRPFYRLNVVIAISGVTYTYIIFVCKHKTIQLLCSLLGIILLIVYQGNIGLITTIAEKLRFKVFVAKIKHFEHLLFEYNKN